MGPVIGGEMPDAARGWSLEGLIGFGLPGPEGNRNHESAQDHEEQSPSEEGAGRGIDNGHNLSIRGVFTRFSKGQEGLNRPSFTPLNLSRVRRCRVL
jgi:hypothetical protein